MNGLHGWLVVDKPVGPTSAQVVGKLKWALRQGGHGKVKIGHGGTLDPLASGVLPIALGEATKLSGYLLNGPKSYRFTVAFGAATSTDDAEGEVVATSEARPGEAAILAAIPAFTGPIRQRPPAYSALKVDGERAYARARAGEEVVLKTRAVTVFSLSLAQAAEAGALEEATLSAHVSKGTYIRSLARDIALALGTVGHVTYLRRTKAGPFGLSQAISLDNLSEAAKARTLEHILLPLRAGLDDIPALSLTPDQAGLLRQGRVLIGIAADDGQHFAMLGDTPVALVEADAGEIRVVRGFNL